MVLMQWVEWLLSFQVAKMSMLIRWLLKRFVRTRREKWLMASMEPGWHILILYLLLRTSS